MEEFDNFFKNFEAVVVNKVETKKEDEKIVKEIVKLARYL
jgi:hypothetical protein